MSPQSTFDYVIVGAGSAGCLLAARLSENSNVRGALVEAGNLPTALASGSAPGKSGFSLLSVRFKGGVYFRGTLRQHVIPFVSHAHIQSRIADRTHRHAPTAGSLAIFPAGIDGDGDARSNLDAVLVAIDPDRSRLAAADGSALGACSNNCFSGFDQALFDFARTLAAESATGNHTGSLFWNEIADGFIDGLVARHTSELRELRGLEALGTDDLKRVRDYIVAHLNEPMRVSKLASIVGHSPSHFSRVFTRSVGVTPHRYVVHLRLQSALELVRDRRYTLAEIASGTGFADQSHLTRWVQRVHGVSPTELVA
jgi:AraC family transcriptional regulator